MKWFGGILRLDGCQRLQLQCQGDQMDRFTVEISYTVNHCRQLRIQSLRPISIQHRLLRAGIHVWVIIRLFWMIIRGGRKNRFFPDQVFNFDIFSYKEKNDFSLYPKFFDWYLTLSHWHQSFLVCKHFLKSSDGHSERNMLSISIISTVLNSYRHKISPYTLNSDWIRRRSGRNRFETAQSRDFKKSN